LVKEKQARNIAEQRKIQAKIKEGLYTLVWSYILDYENSKNPYEENAIVKKEIRQTQETYDSAPAGRDDIREEAAGRIAVYKEFAPKDMGVEQIREVIAGVLAELGIQEPSNQDKGKIMKALMPKVKGKADGKLVNETLSEMMKK